MPSSIVSPFPVFNDLDGTPLEAGYIYIGQSNLNPESAPINVFWDAACTIPAAQPIRTVGGYASRNGTPSRLYVTADSYSITVRNRNRVFVYNSASTGNPIFAGYPTPGTDVSFIQNGTGAVTRNIQDKARESVSVKDFGAVGDGVADDTAAINSAIAYAASKKGARIYMPTGTYKITSTIDVPYSNIIFVGDGADHVRYGNEAFGSISATKIIWNGSNNGRMFHFRSVSGSTKQGGCGMSGIFLDANSLAGYGIHIESQVNGVYSNIAFNEFSSVALYLSTLQANLLEVRDSQRNSFTQLSFTQVAKTGTCVQLDGDYSYPGYSPQAANVSLNAFYMCDLEIFNGNGFVFNNSDTNYFYNCRVTADAGNSGAAIIFNGSNVNDACTARNNVFIGFSVGGNPLPGIYAKGGSNFTYQSKDNNVLLADKTNGTPDPVIEAGASLWYSSDQAMQYNFAALRLTVGSNSVANTLAQRDINTNESLRVYNESENHIVFSNIYSTNTWVARVVNSVDPNTQNFQIIRKQGAISKFPITCSGSGSIAFGDNIYPIQDNSFSCGQNGSRWSSIWAANGTIQTSDAREKVQIQKSALGLEFIQSLNPVSYKFAVGKNVVLEWDDKGNPTKVQQVPGERTHFGLLAQEVKAALPEGVDFGGWVLTNKDDSESQQGLRYEEFIAPLIKAIQELSAEVATLKSKLS